MSRKFVISDPHFGHANIIKFCNRPFSSVEEMDAALIENWNDTVGQNDIVYMLGDFAYWKGDQDQFRRIFEQLHGQKHLIIGNHDPVEIFSWGWASVQPYLELKHNGKWFVMFHYPIESWNWRYHGSIHLYGHVHDSQMVDLPNRFNVSVEAIDYRPVNLDFFVKQALSKEELHGGSS